MVVPAERGQIVQVRLPPRPTGGRSAGHTPADPAPPPLPVRVSATAIRGSANGARTVDTSEVLTHTEYLFDSKRNP